MKKQKVKIIGLVGSLRRDSYNKTLMQAAVELCPPEAEIEVLDINLPLYNQDQDEDMPLAVLDLKKKIESADAVLFASPEYNYSISGALKNAIDWASRPYGQNSFDNKIGAIMSASIGMLGGARAQYHLRQSFVYLNMRALNQPEVMVPFAQEKIKGGKIIDDKTREKIRELVEALIKAVKKTR